VYLLPEETDFAVKLNSVLKKHFGQEPGFAPPVAKAHMSVLYRDKENAPDEEKDKENAPDEEKDKETPSPSQKKAADLIRKEFASLLDGEKLSYSHLVLMKTGGGFAGISDWQKFEVVSLAGDA